jgi:carbamoyltransferase
MKVLGINFSNDAAAALVVDGVVIGAAQEERWTRRKHDAVFPAQAIAWCLAEGGLKLADIDAVGFFWNPGVHAEPANGRLTTVPRDHLEYLYAVPVHLMRHFDGVAVERVEQTLHLDSGVRLRTHYLRHHLCHAAGAFFRSNFERAAILTIDGYGERASTHIGRGVGRDIETLLEVEFPHSVGAFYAAITQYLGFKANSGEGKVMGLASYGTPRYADAMRSLITTSSDGFELDLSYFSFFLSRRRRFTQKLVDLLGPERTPESTIDPRHQDLAASLQLVTEELILHLASIARQRSGEDKLVMSGGVALNCVANGRVVRESGFERCYFMPAASDAGTALGAALYVTHCLGDVARQIQPETDALGPQFDDAAIEKVLLVSGCVYQRSDDIADAAGALLADGHIVGWFQGRAEFGPRALGNRSILADPRDPAMKDTLNARVKFREYFRPFAPVVLESEAARIFGTTHPTPYMLEAHTVPPEHVGDLGAVTHVDGSARVQTIRRDQNARYYDVVAAFGRRTGVPVLVNTSFNIRGEPVVHSVAEALRCYFTTDMDALAIGSFLLVKPHVAAQSGDEASAGGR